MLILLLVLPSSYWDWTIISPVRTKCCLMWYHFETGASEIKKTKSGQSWQPRCSTLLPPVFEKSCPFSLGVLALNSYLWTESKGLSLGGPGWGRGICSWDSWSESRQLSVIFVLITHPANQPSPHHSIRLWSFCHVLLKGVQQKSLVWCLPSYAHAAEQKKWRDLLAQFQFT